MTKKEFLEKQYTKIGKFINDILQDMDNNISSSEIEEAAEELINQLNEIAEKNRKDFIRNKLTP